MTTPVVPAGYFFRVKGHVLGWSAEADGSSGLPVRSFAPSSTVAV